MLTYPARAGRRAEHHPRAEAALTCHGSPARQTMEARHGETQEGQAPRRAATEVGKAAHRVLAANDCKVACPEMNCCGMPALDGGDVEFAKKQARANVERLLPWVENGYKVAVVNPTCSLMMRQEYPELLDDPTYPSLGEAARKIAAAVRDLGEFLFELRKEGQFNERFRSTPNGNVALLMSSRYFSRESRWRGRFSKLSPGLTAMQMPVKLLSNSSGAIVRGPTAGSSRKAAFGVHLRRITK